MANNNRFSITNETWSVTADKAGYTQGVIAYNPPAIRESYTTLQTEIDRATATLDLTGRAFAPTAAEVAAATSRVDTAIMNGSGAPLTIIGGTFYGGVSLSWSAKDGNGVRSASLADNINNSVSGYFDFDGVAKLHDEQANDVPFMCTYPPTAASQKYAPATYNSTTWLQVKPIGGSSTNVVHTDQGDDATNGIITGMTINDPAMQTQIDAAVAGGIGDLTIMVLAGPNVVSYYPVDSFNASTYRMDFTTTAYYPNYLAVAFTGNPDWITEDGHYCMTRSDEKVHYRPPASSSGTLAVLGMLPIMFSDRFGSTNTTNFTGSTFLASGGGGDVGGAYECEGATNSNPVFTDCVFQTGANGIKGISVPVTSLGTTFDNIRARGIASGEGTRIERCRFSRLEKSSGALVQCIAGLGASTPVAETIVKDNFFNNAEANHGQGISLYQGAWMNATIEHNIFVCQRAHSFQNFGPYGESPRNAGGTYNFKNNLIIHDYNSDLNGIGGQSSYSFNSGSYDDGETDLSWDMKVYICNNVILSDMDDPNLVRNFKDYTLDIGGMAYTERYVTDNIFGRLVVSQDFTGSTKPNMSPTYSGYNVATVGGFAHSLNTETNSTDVLVGTTAGWTGSQSDYYDWDDLAPTGLASTHASDGLAVGIRWNGNINLATALNPPADWYTTYSAQTLPPLPTTVPFYGTI